MSNTNDFIRVYSGEGKDGNGGKESKPLRLFKDINNIVTVICLVLWIINIISAVKANYENYFVYLVVVIFIPFLVTILNNCTVFGFLHGAGREIIRLLLKIVLAASLIIELIDPTIMNWGELIRWI